MIRKKLLRIAVALTLCTSLIMPVAGVNMQEVMAASYAEAPKEWNGVDDYVIDYDDDSRYKPSFIETLEFRIGSIGDRKTITLSQDAYTYDADTGKVMINGKKLFDEVSKYCGKNEQITWCIMDESGKLANVGYITYTGEPSEQRRPSIIDAPEEWDGVDDFVIHIDKGAGRYELETIELSVQFRHPGMYSSVDVSGEDITYDTDKGEIRINGKLLLDKIGKYCATGGEIRFSISHVYSDNSSFIYTGKPCDSHYPAVLGNLYYGVYYNGIELNSNMDDIVIPMDKGSGEYEMISCDIVSTQQITGSVSIGSDYCKYNSSKGGVVINGRRLYSILKTEDKALDPAISMRLKLANGEEIRVCGVSGTTEKPNADENGFVIRDGVLYDYFGNATEITIPENVTTINPGSLRGSGLHKVTINGNGTVIENSAFPVWGLEEVVLNGGISYLGASLMPMKGNHAGITVNGMIGNMSSEIWGCDNFIVNGDIAYISGEGNYKYAKIYCKENSNILRYAKENELNYEIIEKQPNEPQIQPAGNEFDGTKDLIFKLDNTSDIKEIKDVYLLLSDNVYDDDVTVMPYSYYWNDLVKAFEYNPETGEVTLFKESVSGANYGYDDSKSIGNTFLGHIVYTAQDGTEKHAFGDWKVKILDKSPNATAQYMYRLPDGRTSISSSDMQDLIRQNETQDICITANGIAYTFAKGTMKVVEGRDSYDFGAEVIKEYGILVNPPFTENEFAFRINYNYEGDLPVMTDITIPAGTQWAGKTLYYYEVTESGFYKYISSSVVDEAGNFTITQNHCSDYVALTKSPDKMPAADVIEKANQSINGTKTYKKTYGDKKFSLNAKSTGNGKLTYSSSDKKVAIVDKNGKVTIKGTGIAVITVKAGATANYNANTTGMKVALKVSPAKQTIKSIKTAKGKKMTVKWKKDTKATGYQIQYSTDKKFKKGMKTVTIQKNKTTSKTITKLKKGKKYYVRVCSYKSIKVNGKTTKLYGKWSSTKQSKSIKK